jgi:ATPase subunit of ABC transporter with duplicated ATPase domains
MAADSQHLALEKEAAELDQVCVISDDAAEIEAAGLRLCEIYDIIAETDDGQRQRRAREILGGLGFDPAMMELPLGQLSGGWRMRSLIAAALFMEPELLLLDEPNNHLDLDAIGWLQHHLAEVFQGTVLCVSHDRAFINAVADEILVFTENHSLEYFTGNLDDLHRHAEKVARRSDRQDAARHKQMYQIEKKIERREQQIGKMGNGLSSNKQNNTHGIYQGLGVTNIDKASARAKKDMKKLERLERGSLCRRPRHLSGHQGLRRQLGSRTRSEIPG